MPLSVCVHIGIVARKWRNCELFQPQNAVPYYKSAVIIAYGREVYQTISEGQVSIKVQQQLPLMRCHLISWNPPSSGVKLNTDGCAKGCPGAAGFGGLETFVVIGWLALLGMRALILGLN